MDSGIDRDAGLFDSGFVDAGAGEPGPQDAGVIDAGLGDGGATDAGTLDSGSPYAGAADAGSADAGTEDAGTDGGAVDAGDGGCDCPKGTWTPTGAQDAGGYFKNLLALDDGRVLVGGPVFGGRTFRFHPNTGTWSNGGTMAFDRDAPLAMLPANRVLVCGGASGSPGGAEVLDVSSNLWSQVSGLVNARGGHAATRLNNNRILISGGSGPSGLVAFAELFDPTTNTFSETGQMIVPRSGHSATLLRDGRVLVAGGGNQLGPQKIAEIYDPTTGGWATSGSMNSPGGLNQAVALSSGKVLAMVGSWGAEVFDPDGGTWLPTGPMIESRNTPGVWGLSELPDGGAIICGNFPQTATCEFYDAASNSWKAAPPMLAPRFGPSLVLMKSGRVLGFAGFQVKDGGGSTPAQDSEIFW